MKQTPKRFSKKVLFPGIAGAFLLFLMSTQFAHATVPQAIAQAVGGVITSIGSAVVGNICYAIGYIIAAVTAVDSPGIQRLLSAAAAG